MLERYSAFEHECKKKKKSGTRMVGSKLFVFLSHILLWISSIELSEMFASSVVGFFVCVSVFRLFCYVETRNGWVILFGCLFSDQRSGVEFSKDRNTNSWTDDGRPTFYTFLFWKQIWSGVLRGTAMIHPSILVTKKLFWVAFSILRNRYCSLFIP